METPGSEERKAASPEVSPHRLIDALERDDRAELARIRTELAAREERALLEFEHHTERAAQERRDGERTLDRIRNVFQAILLDRLLRRRRDS